MPSPGWPRFILHSPIRRRPGVRRCMSNFACGVAGDDALLDRLASLPLEKQQPNLLLAALKYLFGDGARLAAFPRIDRE